MQPVGGLLLSAARCTDGETGAADGNSASSIAGRATEQAAYEVALRSSFSIESAAGGISS
jgi:hypothetical protein